MPSMTTTRLENLPNETLILVTKHLRPRDVQQYLDDGSICHYKEAQDNLRNLCLVSKRMNDVVRPHLYRAIIVDDSDILVKLVRTLAERKYGLGKHIKYLILQVPFDDKDTNFRQPDLSVIRPGSHPLLSNDRDLALLAEHHINDGHYWRELGKLYFHIVKWTTNLEKLSLEIRMPNTGTASSNLMYMSFWEAFRRAAMLPSHFSAASPFLPNLSTVSLLGDKGSKRGVIDTDHCRRVFDVPSVRTLVCHRDDGVWYDLRPTSVNSTTVYLRARGSTEFQFPRLTRLELHKSACTPLHIIDICSTFPSLQALCVYTDCWAAKKKPSDPPDITDGVYLSDALAKLPDLNSLDLDLHYNCDFSHLLGPRGLLNLQRLSSLENLVLPLQYVVEKKTDGGHVVTYPSTVLPPSLRRLHMKADQTCLKFWKDGGPQPWQQHKNQAVTGVVSTTTLLVEFLGAVSSCVPSYFNNLKSATYTYGTHPQNVSETSEEAPTVPHGAIALLEGNVDDYQSRFRVLTEDFKRDGVQFDVFTETAAH